MSERDFSHAPTGPMTEELAAVDPSTTGGQIKHFQDTDFDPEAVAAITTELKEQADIHIADRQEELYGMIKDGKEGAARGSVWDIFRQEYAKKSSDQIHSMVREAKVVGDSYGDIGKPFEDRDVYDKVVADVASDILGIGPGFYVKPVNSSFFEFSAGLHGVADSREIRDNPDVLKKATETLHLLVGVSRYKVQTLSSTHELNATLDLIAEFTRKVPDFDPRAAGLDEVYATLITASAAVKIDADTKPHRAHDYMHLYEQYQDSLEKGAEVAAYEYLRDQPVETR